MTSTAEVIVVTYGQPVLEDRCLESVRKFTDLRQHTLTVFDNYEKDGNLGAVWNDVISVSKHPYVCLLNSDTEVEPGWLDKLIEAADRTGADAVGPMTDHCGIAFQKGHRSDHEQFLEKPTLSGFCLLLRRSSWEKFGRFPEYFPFYGQESFLMDLLPKKVLRTDVLVKHEAGGTLRRTEGRDFSKEKKTAADVYNRLKKFNWKTRIMILGAGVDNPYPIWRGLDQAVGEINSRGGNAVHHSLHMSHSTEMLSTLSDFNPDVVLVVSSMHKQQKAMDNLRQLSGKKALWHNDLRKVDPTFHGDLLKGMFNRVFLCWHSGTDNYSHDVWSSVIGSKVSYMPQGSIINPYLSKYEEKYRSVFIGSVGNNIYHSNRNQFMKSTATQVFNASKKLERIKVEQDSEKIYRSGRYSLAHSIPVPGYNSNRLYNILAYGGLVLVNQFPLLDKLFTEGEHLLTHTGYEDARNTMTFYDDKPDLREMIIKNGWRQQQSKHTVLYRVLNMVHNMVTGESDFWGWL
jgi:hypothetical protein